MNRYRETTKNAILSQFIPFLMPEKTDLTPLIKKRTRNTNQDRIPIAPVVAAKVGDKEEPESKETFQKAVLFITAGLYIAQASPNLLGPRPKTGCFTSTFLVIDIVAPKEGLISAFDIPRRPGMMSPRYPLDTDIRGFRKKSSDIITTTKETPGKFFFFSSSSPLCRVIETL